MSNMNESPAHNNTQDNVPPPATQRPRVLVPATPPEEGEIVEHAGNLAGRAAGVDAADTSSVTTTSLPSVIPETPLGEHVVSGHQASWTLSPSPTGQALRARRAGRRLNSAPYARSQTALALPATVATGGGAAPTAAPNGISMSANPSGDASDSSADLWAQVGTPIGIGFIRTPLAANASAFSLRTIHEEIEGEDPAGVAGEVMSVDELAANASKRVWVSSPSPTLQTRSRERTKRVRTSLPNEPGLRGHDASVHKNPWALSSDGEGGDEHGIASTSLKGPLATSTPRIRPRTQSSLVPVQSDDDFFLDNINASGKPPTPHCQQNSSFLDRLRRSAREGTSREKSILAHNDSDRHSHAHPSHPAMGGSSPLPPSSPIPFDSPTPSIRSKANHETHELYIRNRNRLRSLLDEQESSRGPKDRKHEEAREARGHGREAHLPAEEEARSGRTGRTDHRSLLDRPQGAPPAAVTRGRATSQYVPLPNTRAALYLQEQIEQRAAEAVRPTMTARRMTQTPNEFEQRQETASQVSSRSAMDVSDDRRAHPAHTLAPLRSALKLQESVRSDMDVSNTVPQATFEDELEEGREGPETPTRSKKTWLDTVLGDSRDASPAGRPARSPGPVPPHHDDANVAPIVVPTALTATAPEIDRPMIVDPRLAARVHRDDPEALIRGTSRWWMSVLWNDPPNTSVLVEVFNFQYTESIQTNRIMAEALRRITYLIAGERNVSIVPPDLEDANTRRVRDAPRVWAIRGLTPAGEEALLSRFPWSFRAISFFAYKRTVGPDTWIMSLDGFFDENTHAIAAAVREVLEEDEQWDLLVALTRDHPELRDLPSKQRVHAILDSITVRTWRLSNMNVVASIHIRPPTHDIPKWRVWATGLRSRTYGNFVNGTGIVRRVSNCLGCNSVDHPAHLCPFHDLPGWQGPKAGAGTYSLLIPPIPTANGPPPARSSGYEAMHAEWYARPRDVERARRRDRRDTSNTLTSDCNKDAD
ncbi:hypothetical protein OH76DRAFT_1422786 [Lentinus brumalis]|uniref:Uncharacterized protein n=1 Tax=Lentinus brumalis TaxID=2498619 RepID=A0A371CNW5_9APHY|nr:hypothetical protein OH76DRAFT_1422786 [Polyporus brumalis]